MRESLLQCSGAVPCLFYHMRSPTGKEGAPCGARVFRGRRGGWDFESEGIGRQTIGDEAILAEKRTVAELEGAFICPEGAAAFAAGGPKIARERLDSRRGDGRRAQHGDGIEIRRFGSSRPTGA